MNNRQERRERFMCAILAGNLWSIHEPKRIVDLAEQFIDASDALDAGEDDSSSISLTPPKTTETQQCKFFRPQAGSLSESLGRRVQCTSWEDLMELVGDPKCEVEVKPYAYDERIKEYTHIVTVDGNAVGFTDGPL